MSYYWTTKMNEATARRLNKLSDQGVEIDTSTHAGRPHQQNLKHIAPLHMKLLVP